MGEGLTSPAEGRAIGDVTIAPEAGGKVAYVDMVSLPVGRGRLIFASCFHKWLRLSLRPSG